jgi:hypothetical protein
MCQYVSVVATTKGPLDLYASPGLTSHGDARAGWKVTGGAEVEWTGEAHDSLLVRHEDADTAKTIRAMLMERFPTRRALIESITETRAADGSVFRYHNGSLVFTEKEAGPQFEAVNELIAKLPTFPWCKPAPDLDDELLKQLVAEHLWNLETFTKTPGVFDGVTLKVISSESDLAAARAAAWAAARDAASDAARDAARAAAWAAAWDAARAAAWDAASDAAWVAAWAAAWDAARAAAWDAASDAARDAARAAAHMVADIPNNPWAPLVEIMALGCIPIGVVGDEFVVWKPETKAL